MARKKELYEVLSNLRLQDNKGKSPSLTGKRSFRKKEPDGAPILKSFGEKEIIITYNNAIIMFGVLLVLLTIAFLGGTFFAKTGEKEAPPKLSLNVPAEPEAGPPPAEDGKKANVYRYTVQAITYSNTERNKARARGLVSLFERRGLGKAVVKEYGKDSLVVCVGLTETKEEAEKRRDTISKIAIKRGAEEEFPFKDALVKRVIMRTK